MMTMLMLLVLSPPPQAVLDSVAKRFPSAKVIKVDAEEGLYEVRIDDGGRKFDVDVTPAGHIVETEEEIAVASLPDAVRKAIAPRKMAIRRAERVIHFDERDRPAAPEYELLLDGAGKRVEVVLDERGRVTKEEPKRPGDED